MSMLKKTDFLAGLLFIAFGGLILDQMRTLNMGTIVRMGSAYFPTMLAWILIALGAWLLVSAALRRNAETATSFDFRPLFFIIVGVVAFGLLIERAGILVATAVLVVLAVAGGSGMSKRNLVLLVFALCLFAAGVMGGVMGMTTRILPPLNFLEF